MKAVDELEEIELSNIKKRGNVANLF